MASKRPSGKKPATKKPTKPTKPTSARGFRLERLRMPFKVRFSDAQPHELKQVAFLAVDGRTASLTPEVHELWSGVSVVDVVDASSGEVQYDLYLLAYGDGTLFKHRTTRVAASISQHGFDPVELSRPRAEAFRRAWERDAERLGISDGYIRWDDDEPDDEDDD